MKIWKLVEDVNRYAVLALKNENEILNFSDKFNKNHSLKNEWIAPGVQIFKNDDKKEIGDFFNITSGVWAFNEKVFRFMLEYIDNKKSEILPLISEDATYYILNIFNYIECIDIEKSNIRYFRNSNRVMSITNYVFKQDIVAGEMIFKSTLQKRGPIFISNEFKQKLENSGFRGYRFDLVWDSEL